ncbi:MAG: trypsin-like peptidase domain-containing protein [Chloroflexi bacterium]|nr:trypsin-like peptidase domain-containing protein [Chloroflexota bacterium]
MANTLMELSNDLASTVSAAEAAVVRVEARRRLPASGFVWSRDGVIVTAHHVIEQEDSIVVGLPNGDAVRATLAGRDPTTDLAVLRVQGVSLTPPAWAESGSTRVGHLVLALGRPSKSVLATLGIVSALRESWHTPTGGRVDQYLQADVSMYPGFSGGPLVAASGHVIGLNTTALLRGATLTIPVTTLRRVVETLLAHGKIKRGHLGVGVQPARLPAAIATQLAQETGLLVVAVEPGSPADQAALLLGDTIVGLAGAPVRYPDDLLAGLSSDRIGTTVPVRVLRGGRLQELMATIGERQ